ncbi:MAG: ABC transporter permease [Bifidobacteriaceae bacterium]|jgi:peptide/nickel transport system permease protein|nr:ABC transporter permease [Bifidobacteriaceae bacterium]
MADLTLIPVATTARQGKRGGHRLRRLGSLVAQGVVTLFLVSALVFFATQALPGDVAKMILGKTATPDRLAVLREQLGLNRPLLVQYWDWLSGVLHGDFGESLANHEPVTSLIGERLVNSLSLALAAMLVIIPLSLLVGVAAATHKDSWFDKGFLGVSMVINALPDFIIGTLLIALLATNVSHLLPPVSIIPVGDNPWQHLSAMILPVATLSISGVFYLGRLVRVSFIDVTNSEYIEMARLKGMSQRVITFRHALPNALAAAIPAASLVAAFTIGGVVVVEYVFNYPGIGMLLVESLGNQNLPVIQALVLIVAVSYFFFNRLADALERR